jgi:hypothetical protein
MQAERPAKFKEIAVAEKTLANTGESRQDRRTVQAGKPMTVKRDGNHGCAAGCPADDRRALREEEAKPMGSVKLINRPDIEAIIDAMLADPAVSLCDVEQRLNDDHGNEKTGYPQSGDVWFQVEEAMYRLAVSPVNGERIREWWNEYKTERAAWLLLEYYDGILSAEERTEMRKVVEEADTDTEWEQELAAAHGSQKSSS